MRGERCRRWRAIAAALAVWNTVDCQLALGSDAATDVELAIASDADEAAVESRTVSLATMLQPQPPSPPRVEFQPERPPAQATLDLFSSFGGFGLIDDDRRTRAAPLATTFVLRTEAVSRVATDLGSALERSPNQAGTAVQKRSPIVSDPRVRGSRVGRLAAAGSHWVPARIDLDTMVSKLDSRIVEDAIVIKGPYSVLYGPGLDFIDVNLRDSPRLNDGAPRGGSTGLEYKTNGEQWYGRQTLWTAQESWGAWGSYGHRTGVEYDSGDGASIPSGHKSRDAELALGVDPTQDSRIEFHLLRLDQTDVELPGQAFDVDFLTTDGYEIEYVIDDQPNFDRFDADVWYNRTRFAGSAQREGKRRQFPFYDAIAYAGFTDVDSMSTGYRLAWTWGDPEMERLTAGFDLRYIKQELNENGSGVFIIFPFGGNSPVPRSDSVDPGAFAELDVPLDDLWRIKAGIRADVTQARLLEDPANLTQLGLFDQRPLANILGTNEFDQSFETWAAYATARYSVSEYVDLIGGVGHGQQPPNLTELYAAEPFMFLLQNGLNTVTGDPRLDLERAWQIDLECEIKAERWRGSAQWFYAWVMDYITFENIGIFPSPNGPEQVSLKYVNTELATLFGFELQGEYDATDMLTPFATLSYVQGVDRARNGDFATIAGAGAVPSSRDYSQPRGFFSGVVGPEEEPLPGIVPLEARLGIRVHDAEPVRRWGVEFSARIADDQQRVAASLLESPTPGFATFDLRSYWRPRENLLLLAGVENFTDRNYREHLDNRPFPGQLGRATFQPGVNFYVASELTY